MSLTHRRHHGTLGASVESWLPEGCGHVCSSVLVAFLSYWKRLPLTNLWLFVPRGTLKVAVPCGEKMLEQCRSGLT